MTSEAEKLAAALRLLGAEAVAVMTLNAPAATKGAARALLTRHKVAPRVEAALARAVERRGAGVVRQRVGQAAERAQRARDTESALQLALADALRVLEEDELVAVLEEAAKEAQTDPLASARRFLAGMQERTS